MKRLFFDAGPLISLTMNNLLWILAPLKKKFGGSFSLTDHVKQEIIDKPLRTKRFEYEALQLNKLIEEGVLELIDSETYEHESDQVLSLANQTINAQGRFVRIVDKAEIEVLVAAHREDVHVAVVDERTIRLLLENPEALRNLMSRRLHMPTYLHERNAALFRQHFSGLHIIRSVELVAVAYNLGWLDSYIPHSLPNGRERLLDAILWGVKLDGAAITHKEIESLKKLVARPSH